MVSKEWHCSGCGTTDVTVKRSSPSVDDQYAVGYCDRCTKVPAPPRHEPEPHRARPTIALIHRSVWSPEVFAARLEARRRASLLKRYRDGAALTEAQTAEAIRIAAEAWSKP